MTELNARMQKEILPFLEDQTKRFVTGEGNLSARVMMIGEAPGEQEEKLGRPFVGKAGKNLDAFLQATGLKREEMYISNTVKIRPTVLSKTGRTVNRTPTGKEIELFLPWLKAEIQTLCPEYIVTLGNTALQALCGKGVVIGNVHGQFLEYGSMKLYPLYHPASVIYNPSLKAVYAEDVARFAAAIR